MVYETPYHCQTLNLSIQQLNVWKTIVILNDLEAGFNRSEQKLRTNPFIIRVFLKLDSQKEGISYKFIDNWSQLSLSDFIRGSSTWFINNLHHSLEFVNPPYLTRKSKMIKIYKINLLRQGLQLSFTTRFSVFQSMAYIGHTTIRTSTQNKIDGYNENLFKISREDTMMKTLL